MIFFQNIAHCNLGFYNFSVIPKESVGNALIVKYLSTLSDSFGMTLKTKIT